LTVATRSFGRVVMKEKTSRVTGRPSFLIGPW
jgi:hypothetical protein